MESYFTRDEKAAIKDFHVGYYNLSVGLWNLLGQRFFSKDTTSLSHKYLEEQILLTEEMTFLLSCVGISIDDFIDAQDVRIFLIRLEREIHSHI